MPLIIHQSEYILLHQERGRQQKSWNDTKLVKRFNSFD